MSKAIRVHEVGGPEVLRWEEADVRAPGPGEARVRHTNVGLNFVDVYHRTGLYKVPLPFSPGSEGAGVVTAVGPGVSGLAPGARVAYAGGPPGAYAEERTLAADRLVELPPAIDDRTAAAIMLKGMTAQVLLKQTCAVQPGDVVLFHAAAGGVGQLAVQWAKALGATVIGTVGSDEKAATARALGCDHVVNYSRERFVERVREITAGRGVRVVYDGVGQATFTDSFECLQPRGMLVLFGQSSGAVAPVEIALLAKGSFFLTRPSLFVYTAAKEALRATAADLFEAVARGLIEVAAPQMRPLADAAAAHADLEARRTIGATVFSV